ncbi:hypothetical protein, partial [Geobacillus sp. WSUCF1]|uniref:hypothetical protein n=1 Tax=Geobacillus sp. WSUCF1 TaxID=886559 RepID=UPI001F3AA86C
VFESAGRGRGTEQFNERVKKIIYGSVAQSVETSIRIVESAASCPDAPSFFELAGRGRDTKVINEQWKNKIRLGSSVGRAKD